MNAPFFVTATFKRLIRNGFHRTNPLSIRFWIVCVCCAVEVSGVDAPLVPGVVPPAPQTHVQSATSKSVGPKIPAGRGDLGITSTGGWEYRGDTGQITYKHNVEILDPADNPTTIIRCDWLTLIAPPGGGGIQEIVAITNVVIRMLDPKGVHIARGDKAVYTPTNDTVILTGSPPILETPSQTHIGEKVMIYERRTSRFESPGKTQTLIRQGAALSFLEDPKKTKSTNAEPVTPKTP